MEANVFTQYPILIAFVFTFAMMFARMGLPKQTSKLYVLIKPMAWLWLSTSVYLLLAGLFLAADWPDPLAGADPSQIAHAAARRRGGLILLVIRFWPYFLMGVGGIFALNAVFVLTGIDIDDVDTDDE